MTSAGNERTSQDTSSGGTTLSVKHERERRRTVLAIAIVGLGFVVIAYSASQLKVGVVADPGPGFWPLACSIIGTVCCLIAIADTVFGRATTETQDSLEDGKPPIRWRSLALFVLVSAAFLAFYPLLGFVATALPFTFLLLWGVSRVRWHVATATAVVSTTALYLIFAELLSVRI